MNILGRSRFALALTALVFAACDHTGTYTCVRYAAEVGEACNSGVSCAGGAACVDGTCEVWRDHGEACDETAGTRCLSAYVCQAGVCAGRLGAEGAECVIDAVDACAPGLLCAYRGRSAPVCLPPVAEGERCRADAQCPAGRMCSRPGFCGAPPALDDWCSRERQCAEGLSCVDSVSGSVCGWAPRLEGDLCGDEGCPDDMHCVLEVVGGSFEQVCLIDLVEGMTCEIDSNGPRCGGGTYCDRRTTSCERIGGMGETCVSPGSGEGCEEGLACQPVLGESAARCLPPVPEGASCIDGEMCGANTLCDRSYAGRSWPAYGGL